MNPHDKSQHLPYNRMRRTADMAIKTGGDRFVKRPERPQKRDEVVFENGHNDHQNWLGSFLRTGITTAKMSRAFLYNEQNDRQNGLG
jgi:hypothetical protein